MLPWSLLEFLSHPVTERGKCQQLDPMLACRDRREMWSKIQSSYRLYASAITWHYKFILLTECKGCPGRISTWGLGSTDRATSARSVKERPRADILPVQSQANSVNKIIITQNFSVRKAYNSKCSENSVCKQLKMKLIVSIGNHWIFWMI